MWKAYAGQHPEYAREKMIESYDIEARKQDAKEKKSRDPVEVVPDTPQNTPDFSPGCPPGRSKGED